LPLTQKANKLLPEKEELILKHLEERTSIRGICRVLKCTAKTVYKVLNVIPIRLLCGILLPMATITYADATKHKGRLMALTGLEEGEFKLLLKDFTKQVNKYFEKYTFDGKIRQNRKYTVYKNALLSTDETKLLFVLIFVKNNLTQEVLGTMFDMKQSKVNPWLHTLIIILLNTLKETKDTPARTMEKLWQSLQKKESPLFA
jgi:hypothetical protein